MTTSLAGPPRSARTAMGMWSTRRSVWILRLSMSAMFPSLRSARCAEDSGEGAERWFAGGEERYRPRRRCETVKEGVRLEGEGSCARRDVRGERDERMHTRERKLTSEEVLSHARGKERE